MWKILFQTNSPKTSRKNQRLIRLGESEAVTTGKVKGNWLKFRLWVGEGKTADSETNFGRFRAFDCSFLPLKVPTPVIQGTFAKLSNNATLCEFCLPFQRRQEFLFLLGHRHPFL